MWVPPSKASASLAWAPRVPWSLLSFRRPCAVLSAAFSAFLLSAAVEAGTHQPLGQSSSAVPPALQDLTIEQNLGKKLDLASYRFVASEGQPVDLASLVRGKPFVLVFAYYNCPHLCTLVLNGLREGLQETLKDPGLQLGRDYQVVTVSIDAREKPQLAAQKRANYLEALGLPPDAKGWHFLTGDRENIQRLARDVGFGFRWVESEKQFAHGAALFALSEQGIISRVLYGVVFRGADLKRALIEASQGKIGTIVERFLLFCYRYDPMTRKYSLVLTRVMQMAAALTVLVLGLGIGLSLLSQSAKVKRSKA